MFARSWILLTSFMVVTLPFARTGSAQTGSQSSTLDPAFAKSLFSGQSPATRVFSYAKDKISLTLPANWREMPDSMLQQFRDAANDLKLGLPPMDYRYGFIPSAGTKGSCAVLVRKQGNLSFYSPRAVSGSCATYIMVQFTDRSVSERDLINPDRVRRMQGRFLDGVEKKNSPYVNKSNSSFGDNHYDSSRHLLWQEFAVREGNGLVLHGVTGLYLARKGTVQIHCYASDRDYASLAPDFEKIIASLKLDPSLEYRPSLWDRLPLPDSTRIVGLVKYGFLFLFGIAIIVWALLMNRSALQKQSGVSRGTTF